MVTNKRILITAGPTWVPIDAVRVISNIATGETGVLLTEQLRKAGAKVTLVLGPAGSCYINKKIRVIGFRFFEELKNKVIRELRSKKYDMIIHSAAVSDFAPGRVKKGKINSDKTYYLKLAPLPKIIRAMRRVAPGAKIVIFKFNPGISQTALIKEAREALRAYRVDLAVANRIQPNYRAFILDKDKIYSEARSRKELARQLARLL